MVGWRVPVRFHQYERILKSTLESGIHFTCGEFYMFPSPSSIWSFSKFRNKRLERTRSHPRLLVSVSDILQYRRPPVRAGQSIIDVSSIVGLRGSKLADLLIDMMLRVTPPVRNSELQNGCGTASTE